VRSRRIVLPRDFSRPDLSFSVLSLAVQNIVADMEFHEQRRINKFEENLRKVAGSSSVPPTTTSNRGALPAVSLTYCLIWKTFYLGGSLQQRGQGPMTADLVRTLACLRFIPTFLKSFTVFRLLCGNGWQFVDFMALQVSSGPSPFTAIANEGGLLPAS